MMLHMVSDCVSSLFQCLCHLTTFVMSIQSLKKILQALQIPMSGMRIQVIKNY